MRTACSAISSATAGLIIAFVCVGQSAFAQAPPAASATAPPAGKSLAASVGVMAYPEKKQSATQQTTDEAQCYNWAKTQSGYDPMQPPPVQVAQAPAAQADGSRARGAVGGAIAGTAIGAIAGDTGKGAAIGAVTGVLAGGRQSRITHSQQAQQANAQAAANIAQLQSTFKQGMGVCLQARGYAVK
ncbi:MAG: glycine zipper family protein [Gammaproteobacteria bacterium]